MPGVAIITEACIDVKDRGCVEVCPVQCIYEFDPDDNQLFSEVEPGGGIENAHQPNADAVAIFGDSMLYVNLDECTSCTACYQPDVCPVGAIYAEEHVPDGTTRTDYNNADPNKGHDHTFFIEHSRAVFAD
jgi:Fe-S-cluster-containing hydrogenase component 2